MSGSRKQQDQSAFYQSTTGQFHLGIRPKTVQLAVGRSVKILFGYQNKSNRSQIIELRLSGIPKEWIQTPIEAVRVPAGEQQRQVITIRPSAKANTSKVQAITIQASLANNSAEVVNAKIGLDISSSEKFAVSLHPKEVKQGQEMILSMTNQGNADGYYEISIEPENELELTGIDREVVLTAGQVKEFPIKVVAKNRPIIGDVEIVPFMLAFVAAGKNRKNLQGIVHVGPRISTFLFGLIITVVMLTAFVSIWRTLRSPTFGTPQGPLGFMFDNDLAEGEYIECDTSSMVQLQPRIVATPSVGEVGQVDEGLGVLPIPEYESPTYSIDTLQFLDLPFPYDGGNSAFGGTEEQFRQASRASYYGGRVNSFFDHQYPLYPAPSAGSVVSGGREPADPPQVGKRVLMFNGNIEQVNYSGHPAYDFSPIIPNTATTPVFAAGDGIVEDVGIATQYGGAYFVRIKHVIPEYGTYLTIYWHLEPDQHFDAMLPRIGTQIAAGERIGTIGNTGWSSGHHLHFEVRYDHNGNGAFEVTEKVDPYGFVPTAQFPSDPWAKGFTIVDARGQTYTHNPVPSRYLWVHSLGVSAEIPSSGGGSIPSTGSGGFVEESAPCAPSNSLPSGGIINYSWGQDPPPTDELAGIGRGCSLSVFDDDGNPIEEFDPPMRLEMPYTDADIADINPNTMAVFWKDARGSEYVKLPTEFAVDDNGQKVAIAYVDGPGFCSIQGEPIRDIVPPSTKIFLEGPTINGVVFSGNVLVSLVSDEPNASTIEYSLDGGDSWQTYGGPFTLEAQGVPAGGLPSGIEEGFEPGAGRYLILASSIDSAGNRENPPRSALVIIDPSQKIPGVNDGGGSSRVPHPCCDD